MFLHLSVSHSVQGEGSASRRSAFREVCLQGSVGQTPHQILWDMVNEYVVRILLECILVPRANMIPLETEAGEANKYKMFLAVENNDNNAAFIKSVADVLT